MLKSASKFAMDIFPSVIATILGAYIVNHYIKAPANTAATAAAMSLMADPKGGFEGRFEAGREVS